MEEELQAYIDKQLTWHRKNSHGCLYATRMSKNPPDFKWNIFCVLDDDPKTVCDIINTIVKEAISNDEIYALSILLPNIKNYNDINSLIEVFKDLPDWNVLEKTHETNLERLVGINFEIKDEENNLNNETLWVLGFGNFESFAITRQSPFTELAMTVKTKTYFKKKYKRFSHSKQKYNSIDRDPNSKATKEGHLADVYLKDITDDKKKDDVFWTGTQQRKRRLLNIDTINISGNNKSDTYKTKARVTFVIPNEN